jgi:hypothetical protein
MCTEPVREKSWRELAAERLDAMCDFPEGALPPIDREPVSWWRNSTRKEPRDEAGDDPQR